MDGGSWKYSLPIGSVPTYASGCQRTPVRLHISLAMFLALAIVGALKSLDLGTLFGVAFYATIGLYFTAIASAVARIAAGSCFGYSPKKIVIWPLGAVVTYEDVPYMSRHRLAIGMAGLLALVAVFFVWYGAFHACGCSMGRSKGSAEACVMDPLSYVLFTGSLGGTPTAWLAKVFYDLLYMNMCILVFNVAVPVVPLVASSLLIDALLACGCSYTTAAKAALTVDVLAFVLLVAQWLTFATASNFRMTSPLTLFLLAYLALSVRKLWKALRGSVDALDRHPLFQRGTPPIGTTDADPTVMRGNLAVSLVAGAMADSTAPAASAPSMGGWNPFRASPQHEPSVPVASADNPFAGNQAAAQAMNPFSLPRPDAPSCAAWGGA